MSKSKGVSLEKSHLINAKLKKISRGLLHFKAYSVLKFQFLLQKKNFLFNFNEKFFLSLCLKKGLKHFNSDIFANFKFRSYIRLLKHLFLTWPKFILIRYLTLRFSANNIFLTLTDKKKTLFNCSLGTLKIRGSKKNLAFVSTEFIRKAFDKIKPFLKKKIKIKLTLMSPPKHREYICGVVKKVLRYKTPKIFFFTPDNKCYNGCRPKKCLRKKRVGLYLRRK